MQTISIGMPNPRPKPVMTTDLDPLVGPYQLGSPLGVGGMGRVFEARHRRSGRRVALKTHLSGDLRPSEGCCRTEVELQTRVDHPAVVQSYGRVADVDGCWIALELIEGFTLHRVLRSRPLDATRFLELARQITSGLTAIHRAGVLHCDLKAENIIVSAAPEAASRGRLQAKILDFGIAREIGREVRFEPGRDRGTYRSISPEKALGRQLDQRSDLFSLGVLFYEMLTRISPFDSPRREEILRRICSFSPPSVHKRAPQASFALSRLIDELLEKDANRRPKSAEEVLARIDVSMSESADD